MHLQTSVSLFFLSSLLLITPTTATADQQRRNQQSQRRQTSILPSNLPSCAPLCPSLIDAQQACAPTSGDETTYKSCFCQSAYLNTVKTSPNNICAPQCSDADFGSIASWFKGFCGGTGAAAGQGTTTTAATTTTTSGTGTTTSSAAATAAPANADDDGTDADQGDTWEDPPTWFKGHWKWVVMIVVLVVAFGIIAIVGTIFHRRHRRKRDYGSASTTNTQQPVTHSNLGGWGPSAHSVHDIRGGHDPMPQDAGVMAGGGDGIVSEKGKGKERIDIGRGQSNKRLTKERF